MYAPTLASRLVGDYRKPFLRTIIASFPRQQTKTGKDSAIDRFYKFGLGMEALNRAQIRGQEAQTGLGRETTASKRAGTMKTMAAAGRTAEQAATERELREPRRLQILTQTLKPYARFFRREVGKRLQGKRKGKRKETLADIKAAWSITGPRIDRDIVSNEKQAEKIQTRLDKLEDTKRELEAVVNTFKEPRRAPIPGSPAEAQLAKARQAAARATQRLKSLEEPIEKLKEAKKDLDDKRVVLIDSRKKVDDFFGGKLGARLDTLKREDIDPETAAVLTSVGVISPMAPSSPDRPR
jgi:DNA repair exonuclease SbcCD ATPase subunit